MKNILLASFLMIILFVSCKGKSDKTIPEGKWMILTEQRFFVKNDQITETFDVETVSKEDAYIYDFRAADKLVVTTLNTDFSWEFDVTVKDNVLTLVSVDGQAEADELAYTWEGNKLILTRHMEDADPADDRSSIFVRTVLTLEKVK